MCSPHTHTVLTQLFSAIIRYSAGNENSECLSQLSRFSGSMRRTGACTEEYESVVIKDLIVGGHKELLLTLLDFFLVPSFPFFSLRK